MLHLFRQLLTPFSILYGLIIRIRNILYDKGILKSTSFDTPTIIVGNLNVGGTGKSPMIEYLIRLLKEEYQIAVLSRGYKRKSKGFQIATNKTVVSDIGDEPMQFFRKFKNIIVAVSANRVTGINSLISLKNPPDVILLDDAYQHRKLQGGFKILLTPFYNLFIEDSMLPTGDLREGVNGAKRADVIIVSKCPDLNMVEKNNITNRLKINTNQSVFFTKIGYANFIYNNQNQINMDTLLNYTVLLITGIAKTKPLTDFLDSKRFTYEHLKYKDHHNFRISDLEKIKHAYTKIVDKKKLILTTEKDYVRTFEFTNLNVYYLPIRTVFIHSTEEENQFTNKIKGYVGKSTRDC